MAYNYGVKNTDPNFIIDPVTRSISQKSGKSKLMQYDHNSECYGFEIPRFIDGHDMSLCDVTIHYINIASNKSSVVTGSYPASDVSVVGDNVVFTWLVSRNATGHNGTLNFAIGFERSTDGTVDYSWHTDIFKGISICETLYGDGTETVEPYSDVLNQWKTMLFGIGDTEETSIKEVSQAEQDAITAKGAVILASIPDDYSTTYYMANEAFRAKGNAIVESAEGECVVVSDSSDDYLRGLSIFGKSTQKTTTGKNLFEAPNEEATVTGNGMTYVRHTDGRITITGTSTAVSNIFVPLAITIEAGTSFAVSINNPVAIGSDAGSSVSLRAVDTLSYSADAQYGSTFVTCSSVNATGVVTETFDVIAIQVRIPSGLTLENFVIKPQVEIGSEATDFETYSGGFASPSPDWTQEIGNLEDVTVSICGKNLLNHNRLSNISIGNITVTNNNGRITISGSGTTTEACNIGYSVSHDELMNIVHVGEINLLTVKSRPYLSVTLLDNVTSEKYLSLYHNTPSGTITQKMLDNENLVMNVSISCGVGEEIIPAVFNPILYQHGDETWDSYKIPQPIQIDRPLPGIPVTSDGNYTDEDGQQWICDEIDFERGVYIQRVGVIENILTDSNGQNIYENSLTEGYVKYTVRRNLLNMVANADHVAMGFCNRFVVKPISGYITNNDTNKITCIGWSRTSGGFYMMVPEGAYTDLSAFVADITDNPVSVTYVLATPVETSLTANELTAFKSLHSNYPNTTVLNNAGAHMKVKYNADTKLYIDNKFAELAAKITSNT